MIKEIDYFNLMDLFGNPIPEEIRKSFPHFEFNLTHRFLQSISRWLHWESLHNSLPWENFYETKNFQLHCNRNTFELIKKNLPHTLDKIHCEISLSFSESCQVLSDGLQELHANHPDLGDDSEKILPKITPSPFWLKAIKENPKLQAISKLQKFFESELGEFSEGLLIHGSAATLDYQPGFSDLDTAVWVNNETVCDPHRLETFFKTLHKSLYYLMEFNPHTHHGHYVFYSLEKDFYSEGFLPLICYEKGFWFGDFKKSKICLRSDKFDSLISFLGLGSFLRNSVENKIQLRDPYDLLWWTSNFVMVVMLYLTIKTGKHLWKSDSLMEASKTLPPEHWNLVKHCTNIRNTSGKFLKNLPENFTYSLRENPGLVQFLSRIHSGENFKMEQFLTFSELKGGYHIWNCCLQNLNP